MRYDDDDDYDDRPVRRRPQGVSAGWRVAAGVSGALAAIFALMLVIAFGALLDRPRTAPPPPVVQPPFFPPQQPVGPFPAAAQNDDDPDKGDPKALPYPLTQDLRPLGAGPAIPGEPVPKQEPSPRDQFLRTGEILWANDEPNPPENVLVSPDGANIAYIGMQGVMAGPPQALRLVAGTEPKVALPRGGPAGVGATAERGALAWSALGNALYWAAADGRIGIINFPIDGGGAAPINEARARWAIAIPPLKPQVVLVRDRARPKVESPLRKDPADPSEVVVFDREKKVTRILIPLASAVWRSPAVSPDGKRLALISDSGNEGMLPSLWRVFVIDLAGGEPKPLTPASSHAGSVCWAPDGKTLIYDRSAFLNEENFQGEVYRTNLFEVDAATGRESPLSVGGGFSSPSVSRAGDLFCLAHSHQADAERIELFRVPRDKARAFAAKQPPGRRSVKAWTELAAAALREAGLPADARVGALDEDKVKKLATAFAKGYREHFLGDVPDTAAELDRLRGETRGMSLPPGERRRIGLVLGAVEGEYLRRKHGARWVLTKPAGEPLTDPKPHELFRHVVNPFRDFWAEDFDDPDFDEEPGFGTLMATLSLAEGRPLVLAHDSAVHSHVPAADPDLARGTALLKEGQGDEADRVLLEMTKRHAGNYHLALHVGALLADQGHTGGLRTLVGRLDADALKDARVYNLMGVSRLDDDPRAAAVAFRNALRCNLYFGPAYFNLALAHERLNDVASARLCLRRYLKLMSYAPLADDARRRLAELPSDPAR
jgi:WD40-like Beta Propeller Repeat